MKLWTLLLALYVLVLAGLPCEAFCRDEPVTASTTSGDQDQYPDDGCSPFCLCATCPGFTIPPSPRLLTAPAPTSVVLLTGVPAYQPAHALMVYARIWQPPRFANPLR